MPLVAQQEAVAHEEVGPIPISKLEVGHFSVDGGLRRV